MLMKGFFQHGCGLFTDLGLSDLPIGRTGEEAASIPRGGSTPLCRKLMAFWPLGKSIHWCESVGG